MPDLFKNKYRIASARLQAWDYTSNSLYFITICTQNREHFFGDIVETLHRNVSNPDTPTDIVETLHVTSHNPTSCTDIPNDADDPNDDATQTMQLNAIGCLAHQCWLDIPNHFPFVELGNFVIMPDHIHGILIINRHYTVETSTSWQTSRTDGTDNDNVHPDTLHRNVSHQHPDDSNAETLQCNVSTNDDNKNVSAQMAGISPKPGSISVIIRTYKAAVSKNARLIHADFGWQTRFYDRIIRSQDEFMAVSSYITHNPANWGKKQSD